MKFFKFIISMISVVFYSAYADDYSFYKKEASSNYIFLMINILHLVLEVIYPQSISWM